MRLVSCLNDIEITVVSSLLAIGMQRYYVIRKNHLSKEHCLPPTRNEQKIANNKTLVTRTRWADTSMHTWLKAHFQRHEIHLSKSWTLSMQHPREPQQPNGWAHLPLPCKITKWNAPTPLDPVLQGSTKREVRCKYLPFEAIYENISRLHAFWTKMPVPFENKVPVSTTFTISRRLPSLLSSPREAHPHAQSLVDPPKENEGKKVRKKWGFYLVYTV